MEGGVDKRVLQGEYQKKGPYNLVRNSTLGKPRNANKLGVIKVF